MAKKPVKPAPSTRKGLPLAICAFALGAAAVGGARYWYVHRPPTVKQYLEKGDDFAAKGHSAMAIQQYMAAAALKKTDAAPYLAMSKIEEAAGNLGTAADRLGTVLYYHPDYPHIQCRRAQLYGMANRYEMAYTIAKDAVKIEPGCAVAHNDMGMLLELSDDTAGAARELGTAHSLAPDDEALTLDYARVLAKSGKADDALNIVNSVLPITKKFTVPANYIEGWILAEYGRNGHPDYKNAQIFLATALTLNHDHTASLAESGKIFLHQKLYIAAQDQLLRAFRNGPDTIDMLDDLVAVYRAERSPQLADAVATTNQMKQMLLPLKSYRRRWLEHPDDLDNNLNLARAEMGAGNKLDAFDLIKHVLAKEPQNKGAYELYAEMKSPTAPPSKSTKE